MDVEYTCQFPKTVQSEDDLLFGRAVGIILAITRIPTTEKVRIPTPVNAVDIAFCAN